MIAIVDGGSTKCAWAILNDRLETISVTQTIGLNAYLITQEDVLKELSQNKELAVLKDKIQRVFFYNTGCGTLESQELFKKKLQTFFTDAKIQVKGDLLGSAYALYTGKPCIAGILGTGSNSCYFDGEKIHKHIPSLGYVLGDEGGGVALGKRILKAYFYHQMPKELSESFEKQFNVDLHEVLKGIYSKPKANAYIGSFTKFLTENREHPFCKELVQDEMKLFFETQIIPYQKHHCKDVSLVGSITYYFEGEIRSVAHELDLTIGKLIKSPLEDLVDYHKKYILNT